MGIKDLLKFMKPHVETIHIKKYAGKRVGIDAYSWLHKGAYSCSMELCLNMEGDKKFQYLNYFMHRINLLRHYKITPVVVFDGQNIPCKAATEHERTRRRKANRDLAMAKLKEGNVTAATELFQRAVSISPSMAHQLIQILRSEDIDYVVAPYEADAQLAYLSSLETAKGGIEGVISEDSDLLAYGCPSIIFKMDRFGNGEEKVLSKAFESTDRVPSFRSFNMELFTGMCVLAGCDFLSSVPGIGIVKAYSLVSKYRNLDRALSILRFEKGNVMPEDYIKSFREALSVFQHALVYDSNSKSLKHIKPLPEKLLQSLDANLDFLGPEIPQSIAAAIAEGNLDPSTMEAFDQYPSSKIHLRSSTISLISSRPLKLEATAIAKEDSCFSVITSHRAKKEKTTMMKRKPVKEEPKYLNEVTVLEKLVCSLTTPPTEENKKCTEKVLLKVPENNPFKRKLEEVQLNEMERITEEVSMSAEAEDWEVLCITPESQQNVNSKPIYGIKKAKTEKSNSSITQNKESKKSSILNFFQRVLETE